LKTDPLTATVVRNQVRMDPHLFHPLFKWLQEHEYCQVKKEKNGRAWAKVVDLTSIGQAVLPALQKGQRWGHLKEIVNDFSRASSSVEEINMLLALIVEAFDIAYSQFYGAGRSESYNWFRGGLEERLRESLEQDRQTSNRTEAIDDVYLMVREIPSVSLLRDAELAREKGHFLTSNHRYILTKRKNVEEKDLIDHNIQWSRQVMSRQFGGNESLQDFLPSEILERERRERQTPQLLGRQTITFARDDYDYEERWSIAALLLKAWQDNERRERVAWLEMNQPWRIRDSELLPLILHEDIL